tara:strand:+ start:10482 stop:10760 length:279 start_codon:yes stop_codon:yes gene_type:complete
MKCVFYSTYGYNTSIRNGKIYDFNKNTIKYLLEVNKDLILLSNIFKKFFLRIINNRRLIKYICKNYKNFINFLFLREIGKTNITIEKNKLFN